MWSVETPNNSGGSTTDIKVLSSVMAGGSASVQGYAQKALAVTIVTVSNLRPPFIWWSLSLLTWRLI